MGYRSDVRIVVSKKGNRELNKYVKSYLKRSKIADYNLLKSCDIKYLGRNGFCLGWNSIKWYESDDEIKAIMDGLYFLEENNLSYRYARIGESYVDYEEDYYESEIESEQDLPYPCMMREFDDNEIQNELDFNAEDVVKDKEVKNNEILL